ncbi:F-box protein [Porphyridium purpureum]|uniref:F-box protein n=1 Tax=Porphyridium purpureum TaxID=35688 RepID=A0A5J4Z2Q9_PORPP|nr:F-box protein [Porphyridium purpureum]|eukprot:POR1059..scf295_1
MFTSGFSNCSSSVASMETMATVPALERENVSKRTRREAGWKRDGGAEIGRYGVMPVGNLMLDSAQCTREEYERLRVRALGLYFSALPDELVLRVLGELTAADLASFSVASKMCYVYAHNHDLWRSLVFNTPFAAVAAPEREEQLSLSGLRFAENWKSTYMQTNASSRQSKVPGQTRPTVPVLGHKPREFYPVYSDVLFHAWKCFSSSIDPAWLHRSNIPHVAAEALGVDEFRIKFGKPNLPVVVENVTTQWPAYHKWTRDYLIESSRGQRFNAGGYLFTMEEYFSYLDKVHDEQPLYLFDKAFVSRVPAWENEFAVPEYFKSDLFKVLEGTSYRPDHQWLIIGGARSGSTFHMDPNATSAWNAVIRGRKKWVLFPPDALPPGVVPNEDGSDVCSPVSVMEWFLNFYASATAMPECYETICEEGDCLFVPQGWWHIVLNLDDVNVAVTQNFADPDHLVEVLLFLRTKSEKRISGVRDELRGALCDVFESELQEHYPEEYRLASARIEDFLSQSGIWKRLRRTAPENIRSETSEAAEPAKNQTSAEFHFDFLQ